MPHSVHGAWYCQEVNQTLTKCWHEGGNETAAQVPGFEVFLLLTAGVVAAFLLWARKRK